MTEETGDDVRHEGSSFEPVPREPGPAGQPPPGYPPEADPDKAGDLPAAEVPGEQTDPDRRLTGGDQAEGSSASTQGTRGSVEPPD